jgi:hypothetical protein
MTEADKLAKIEKLLKRVMGNYQVASEIAKNEGFETNFGQDEILVNFMLKELSVKPDDNKEIDIDKANANEEAFFNKHKSQGE